MSLPTAYPLASAKPVSGVLPPAYGTSAYAGALPLAYGNTEVVLLDQFGHYEGITYTQSGNLTYFDSTGTLQAAAVNTMVLDYDPSTLALRGYPFWEARTNSIRNNTMQGAIVGTIGSGGAIPTNWFATAAAGNLTSVAVIATGTESGINYVDIQFVTSGAVNPVVIFDGTTQIAASNGQTWATSQFLKLAGGSLTNVTVNHRLQYRDAGGANLQADDTAVVPTSAGLATQRISKAVTASNASTAFVTNGTLLVITGAASVTLRIGLPQLELGAFATPVIKTTSAAVTRSAPSCAITGSNFTSFYNQNTGTFVIQCTTVNPSSFAVALQMGDGTSANQMTLDRNAGSARFINRESSVNTAIIGLSAISANTAYKEAAAYQLNNYAAAMNGVAGTPDTSAAPPTVNQMGIGMSVGGGNYINGWLPSVSYYASALQSSVVSLST